MHRLRYMAPRRHCYKTEIGLWADEPWTAATMKRCIEGGGWFGNASQHDFSTKDKDHE